MMRFKNWHIFILYIAMLMISGSALTSCSADRNEEGESSSQEDSDQQTVADNSYQKSTGSSESEGGGVSENEDSDDSGTVEAVDAGNPTGVGPDEDKSKLRLYIADAPIIDDALAFLIRPVGITLVKTDDTEVQIALPPLELDLLQYRNGLKYLLFDGNIPSGEYQQIRVVLDLADPATLILSNGTAADVFVPSFNLFVNGLLLPAEQDERSLFGDIDLVAVPDDELDVTMHVDLRRNLLPINLGLPLPWLPLALGADYWLIPAVDVFLSDTVGAITGFGLAILAKYVCAFPVGATIPAGNGTAACAAATGTGVIEAGQFHLPYLEPGSYVLRLYITEAIYLPIGTNHIVNAAQNLLIDLGL